MMLRPLLLLGAVVSIASASPAAAFCCKLPNQLMSGLVSLSGDQSIELSVVNAASESCSLQVELLSQEGVLLRNPATVQVMSGKAGVASLGTGREMATAGALTTGIGRRARVHVNLVVTPLSDTCSQWSTATLEVINSNGSVARSSRLQ